MSGGVENADVVWFDGLLALLAIVAGGIAALAGFGIGSLLTPALATVVGVKAAVAVVWAGSVNSRRSQHISAVRLPSTRAANAGTCAKSSIRNA